MEFKDIQYVEFVQEFAKVLREGVYEKELSDLVFLCIGTDRITGDSFGPLVGYNLKELYKEELKVHIFGDLERPVSSNNIERIIRRIDERYSNPYVIAIDSAVSRRDNIGKIVVSERALNLGSSLDKKDIKIGDISIKGVVSEDLKDPKENFNLLQNTSLNLVLNMANLTAKGIYNVINV